MQIVSPVKDGKLVNRGAAQMLAKALMFAEGKTILITVQEHKSIRSAPQNSFYWGGVIPPITRIMQRKFPEDQIITSDAHTACKFFGGVYKTRYDLVGWEKHKTLASTTSLTTDKFSEYLEKLVAFAAGEGEEILWPDEYNGGKW